jgi:hypothetical protein
MHMVDTELMAVIMAVISIIPKRRNRMKRRFAPLNPVGSWDLRARRGYWIGKRT